MIVWICELIVAPISAGINLRLLDQLGGSICLLRATTRYNPRQIVIGKTLRITDTHVAHYREHGFTIIENFLTSQELDGAHVEIERFIPGLLDYAANPQGPKPPGWDQPSLSRRNTRFPFAGDQMNSITLHPELRRFAAINAGHDDLFCEQGHFTYKCRGHAADMDQTMHLDYMNHTLVYPPANKHRQTAYLIYFTDVDEGLAPTAVCSKQHYPEKILWPTGYDRDQRPELYNNEVKATVPAGSVLAYSMRTFHRGTAFQKDGARIGAFITYAPKNCPWLGIVGWPEQGVRKSFRIWIERASVAERELLGFPAPGHDYWTEETLAGVAARFPEMDLDPYRA